MAAVVTGAGRVVGTDTGRDRHNSQDTEDRIIPNIMTNIMLGSQTGLISLKKTVKGG